jgi:small-conductance mechanosensitive channel
VNGVDQIVREPWVGWAIGGGIAVGFWLIGWLLRRIIVVQLTKLFRRTQTEVDDVIVQSLAPYLPFWFLLAGVTIGMRFTDFTPTVVMYTDRATEFLLIMSVSFALARLAGRLVALQASKSTAAAGAATLTQNVAKVAVLALGLLVALNNLGIALTPILTALGVGSLAVALALQPTLSNFFAGLHLTVAQLIRVGDTIELDTGQRGLVSDIGWRSTLIREAPNSLIIVPNAKLTEIVVRNYSMPTPEVEVRVPFSVAYDADLGRIEKVVLEVARGVLKTAKGAVPEFEPVVRFEAFGAYSIDAATILRAHSLGDRMDVQAAFVKALHSRFAAEGIEMPFPQRVVRYMGLPESVTGRAPSTGEAVDA